MQTAVRETRNRQGLVYVGMLGASLVLGLSIAQGGRVALLLAGAVVGIALLVCLMALREKALLWWAVISVSVYPFLRVPRNHALITFDRLWIVALVGILLAEQRAIPATRATRALTRAFAIFALWYGVRAVATVPYSSSGRLATIGTWIDAGLLPLLLFIAARRLIVTTERARRLGGALALAGTILAGIGISERIAGYELATLSGGTPLYDTVVNTIRISGPFPGTEMFIVSLLICLAGTFYWIQSKGPPAFILGGAAATLQVVALGLTLFRVAWLATVIVVVVAFGLRPRQFTRAATVVVIAGVAVAIAFTFLDRNQTFATRLSGQVAQNNITGRLVTYTQGYRIFRKSPLVGVGVNRFQKVSLEVPVLTRSGIRALGYPHNSYLGILAEQGIIGFAALVALSVAVWRVIRRLRLRAKGRDDVLLAACVTAAASAYILASLSLYLVPAGPANVFMALVVGAAAGRLDAIETGSEDSVPAADGG